MKNEPNLYVIHDTYINSDFVKKLGTESLTPDTWHKFLKEELGVHHTSMSRLKVTDRKKYFLAKIKYGI